MEVSAKTNKIVISGIMMGAVTLSTMLIAVPVPFTNGYIHLGDSMVFLSVLILGWQYGVIIAGAGSALADLFLGYVHWAPWTLVIKGLMALVMGLAIEKTAKDRKNTSLVLVTTIVLWGIFNMAVSRIVRSGIEDLSALGSAVNSIQAKLMFLAIVIPLALVVIAVFIKRKEDFKIPLTEILAMTLSGLFMVFGYYIAGGMIYGNFAVAAFSIPMNILQFVMGFFVASLIRVALYKTPLKAFFHNQRS